MIDDQCVPSDHQSAPKPPRRNHPVLANLTHAQKQQLVDLCQTMHYTEAAQHAREKLGIQISVGTLSNLCTGWQIREDNDTREQIESDNNTTIESLTEKQLQLRLLELASRPNMDHTELRAITQSFARLQSVKLSERRVQLAEAKETRLAQKEATHEAFTQKEIKEGFDVMLGRGSDDDPVAQASEPAVSPISKSAVTHIVPNEKCSILNDQCSTNSAPEPPSNPPTPTTPPTP